MTRNQIAFQELQETRRANAAREQELARRNSADIRHQDEQRMEQQRHNVASEQVASGTLHESVRHNTANEGIASGTLLETGRHNVATEEQARIANARDANIRVRQAAEAERHNRKVEDEAVRHNLAAEGNESMRIVTDRQNAQTRRDELAETVRHNNREENLTGQRDSNRYVTDKLQADAAWTNAQQQAQRNDIERRRIAINAYLQLGGKAIDLVPRIVSGFFNS